MVTVDPLMRATGALMEKPPDERLETRGAPLLGHVKLLTQQKCVPQLYCEPGSPQPFTEYELKC
jgi:hypothetical protein